MPGLSAPSGTGAGTAAGAATVTAGVGRGVDGRGILAGRGDGGAFCVLGDFNVFPAAFFFDM